MNILEWPHLTRQASLNEVWVKNLCHDSRHVKPGDLFIAVPGLTTDGRKYINTAIEKGAVAVLAEDFGPSPGSHVDPIPGAHSVPIIPYSNLKNTFGHIAARFYGDPSKLMPVIGITGTNGKTSCSHFIAELSSYFQTKTAIMGTLGNGFLGKLETTSHTTVDAIEVQKTLANLLNSGANMAAMEVTAHALSQGRVEGVHFHTAILTNLTRDHLDDYKTMAEYWQAKKRLFLDFTPAHVIVNVDDEHGRELFEELRVIQGSQSRDDLHNKYNSNHQSRNLNTLIGYSTRSKTELNNSSSCHYDPNSLITTEYCHLDENGIQAEINTPFGNAQFHCQLLGRFNLSNILASLAALCVQGIPLSEMTKYLPKLNTVNGRMLRLGGGKNQPIVVVDFAHTPDALKEVLMALRPHCRGKLWCVFGCGGERDPGKRPIMAETVEKLSDRAVVTQDNSRTEDGNRIIHDIMKGFNNQHAVKIEPDRAKAIDFAIQSAAAEDIVVVAGKGHETYQWIGNEKIPFSDEQVVNHCLVKRGKKCNP